MTGLRMGFVGGGYARRLALAPVAVVICAAVSPTPAAEIPGFSYSDGVRTVALTLVTTEVAVDLGGGDFELRRQQIPTTLDELRLFLVQVQVNERRAALPVFYRAGAIATRLASARFVLEPRLAVFVEDDATAAALFARHGLVPERKLDYLPNTYILRAGDPFAALEAANRIAANEPVFFATPLLRRQRLLRACPPPASPTPNDPLFDDQWNLYNTGQTVGGPGDCGGPPGKACEDLNWLPVWQAGVTGAGVVIGIVDEGLEFETGDPGDPDGLPQHPDLDVRIDLSHDFRSGDETPENTTPDDLEAHGAAVAGVAAAIGNNNAGLAGVAPGAEVASLRLPPLNDTAEGMTDSEESDALSWMRDAISIYNNSWGPPTGHSPAGPLVRGTLFAGVREGRAGLGNVFVWAAGNDGFDGKDRADYDGYANSRYTIAVGATDADGKQAVYSEAGACLMVNAPSNRDDLFPPFPITSTDLRGALLDPPPNDPPPDRGWDDGKVVDWADDPDYLDATDPCLSTFGGTSAATPAVAGVVALMLEVEPSLTWRDVQDILVRTAVLTPLPQNGGPDSSDDGDGNAFNRASDGHLFHHDFGFGRVDAEAGVAAASDANWETLAPFSLLHLDGTVAGGFPATIPTPGVLEVTFEIPTEKNIESIEHVEVFVDIVHDEFGGLDIRLISPNDSLEPQPGHPPGVTSILAIPHSGEGPGPGAWTYLSVRHWDEPAHSGTSGTWTLRIEDTIGGSSGTLEAASIRIFGVAATRAPFGDADGDGDIDLADEISRQACFTGSGGTATPACQDTFDSDGDADVDLGDKLMFDLNYTGARPPAPALASSNHPDGWIDPLSQADGAGTPRIDHVTLTFDQYVVGWDGFALNADDFDVATTDNPDPDIPAPPTITVTDVDTSANPVIVVTLSEPIPYGEWTSLTYRVQNPAGVESTGAVDLAHLPCDVNQDGQVDSTDTDEFMVQFRAFPTPLELVDTDRNGFLSASDVTEYGGLFNGYLGFIKWSGKSLPPRP